jgi:hypothetical protein
VINALIEIDDHEINIVNIYAPRTDTERKTFYSELDKFISTEHNNRKTRKTKHKLDYKSNKLYKCK